MPNGSSTNTEPSKCILILRLPEAWISAVISARLGTSRDSIWAVGGRLILRVQAFISQSQGKRAHLTLRLRLPIVSAISGFLVNIFLGFLQSFYIWKGFRMKPGFSIKLSFIWLSLSQMHISEKFRFIINGHINRDWASDSVISAQRPKIHYKTARVSTHRVSGWSCLRNFKFSVDRIIQLVFHQWIARKFHLSTWQTLTANTNHVLGIWLVRSWLVLYLSFILSTIILLHTYCLYLRTYFSH